MEIYYCPKCESTDIKIEVIDTPETKPLAISIDNLSNIKMGKKRGVKIIKNCKATCRNCGYNKKFNG